MSTCINKFNFLFEEFINKIIHICPNNKIISYKKAFLILKMTSPSTPVSLMMSACIDYKSQIKNRDENFFINNKTVKESVSNFSGDIGIKDNWNQFTDLTKIAIWDYIQSLFVLGEIAIANNPKEFKKFSGLLSSNYKQEISNLDGDNFSVEFISKINS